jgi:hypothetical protein
MVLTTELSPLLSKPCLTINRLFAIGSLSPLDYVITE